MAYPVAVLRGMAGCGKSVALRGALAAGSQAAALYDVPREHRTLARFVRGLAEALRESAPGARLSFASAYERAMQSGRPAADLAAWMLEHLRGVPCTIALDNLHHALADPRSGAFLSALVDRCENVRWLLACRDSDVLPIPVWMSADRMSLPVDDADLAFNAGEVAALARAIGTGLDERSCAAALERTGGWATGVAYLLHSGEAAGNCDEPVRAFEPVIERALGGCDSWELRALLGTSAFPELSEALLASEPLRAAVARLFARAPYLFVSGHAAPRYHDRVAEALQARLRAGDPREVEASIAVAGAALRHQGRFVEALELYTESGLAEPAIGILELHGLELLEGGDADVVERALVRLERAERAVPPILLALRAIVESRLGRFDVAESWFNQALRRSADDDVRMVEIKYLYACDLVRRDRLDAIELLSAHAYDDALPSKLRAELLSALGQALMLGGEANAAAAAIDKALELARDGQGDELRARVFTRAAYVGLYRGELAAAREYARTAARIAEASSLFSVATGAYSVLFAIAFDDEAPLEALDALERLFEHGLKSGNLQFQFYYLANAFEIAAERHDLASLERLDAALRSFDLQFDDAYAREALLPGHALRASWQGDFERSYRMLAPTAGHEASDDRSALRWAEVALYAAAALRPADARAAALQCDAVLATIEEPSNRVQRARLLAALAFELIGETYPAAMVRGGVLRETLPARLAALADAVDAVRARCGGAANHAQVLHALDALYRAEFGGLARLIEALPLRALRAAAGEVPA